MEWVRIDTDTNASTDGRFEIRKAVDKRFFITDMENPFAFDKPFRTLRDAKMAAENYYRSER